MIQNKNDLNPFRIGFLGAAHRWGEKSPPPPPPPP